MAIKHLTYACIPLIAASMSSQAATVDQLNRQVQKLSQRIAAQDQRFRVNGFASFGITQSDEAMTYNGIGDETNFDQLGKAGVQMTFNMDRENSVVMQLVSRGENDWDTTAEWAYFKHEFGNGLSGKIGRIRLPAYQLSEFLDVGYAVPYAVVPPETYDSLKPFSNMNGIDLSYSMDVGDNTMTFQIAHGRTKDDEFDLKGLTGTSVLFQADTWSARASYGWAELALESADFQAAVGVYGGESTGIDASFTSLGFTFDPGDIYFTSEFTQLKIDGEFVDADAMYATIGYRFGRLMPTLTFATTESTDDDERTLDAAFAKNTALAGFGSGAGILAAASTNATAAAVVGGVAGLEAASNRDTQRIGLGLRYDMSAGTSLKVQYDIIEVDGASGLFDDSAWANNAATGGTNPDSTNILTISIDTVF
jgi:hypothetical protein